MCKMLGMRSVQAQQMLLLTSFPSSTLLFPKYWSLALNSSGSSHLCLLKSVLRWLWILLGLFRVGSALSPFSGQDCGLPPRP